MSAQSWSGSISSRGGQGLRTLARLGAKFDPPLSLLCAKFEPPPQELFGAKFEPPPPQELFGAKFEPPPQELFGAKFDVLLSLEIESFVVFAVPAPISPAPHLYYSPHCHRLFSHQNIHPFSSIY
ncbi:hypothetical protein Pcinc_031437 [Petrolisthes cinctipes]|uniref:Uncharacterized protein n=1 Tax=Petrolisthes cinctipes TaxID=88211 RepID=A0AAE1EWD6_PETCI|nr:hypothetical protein Pcinc_031437 [Petrolisthes cinctipes]